MKSILLVLLICSVLAGAAAAQSTRSERVPGMPAVLMGPEAFENLTISASLDRFGDITERDLKVRVDRYLSILRADNKTVEYLVVLDRSSKSLKTRVKWFTDYLASRKISVTRFSFGFAETENGQTELWLSPNSDVKAPRYPDAVIVGADDADALSGFLKGDR